jgi:hypothetical protein
MTQAAFFGILPGHPCRDSPSLLTPSPLQRVRPKNVVRRPLLSPATNLPSHEHGNSAAQKEKLLRGMAPSLLDYCGHLRTCHVFGHAMKLLRRQKKTAIKPARGRRPAPADARVTLSTFGGSLLALESRIMFDGAAAATVSTVTTEQVAHSQAEASVSAEKAVTTDTAVHAPTGEAPTGFAAPPTGDQALVHALATYDSATAHHEILFISASVLDYQQLLDGVSPNVEVHVLDPTRDGVAQMVQILAGRTGIDAIHLIGDGSEAEMQLGASFLTQESISTTYAAEFQQIGRSLSASADILIYGCDFGRGADGLLAMNTLATLTGAAVAASTDPTGNAALGANWVLEASTGSIDTSVVIGASTQAAWDHTLLTYFVTTTADSGAGSLRQAIINADASGVSSTIDFTIPGLGLHTINLASALPTITVPVMIDGYSEAGSSVNTLSVGDNAVLTIELNGTGAGAGATGLVLGAGSDGSTIRGLVINRFTQDGIDVSSTTDKIVGNWIGTDATGTLNAGNGHEGVAITAITGNNATIGSATLADRNVLSGNGDEGVDSRPGVTGTVIQGNYIGTNAMGTAAIPNGLVSDPTSCGVDLTGGVLLGGSLAGQGNLISGNTNANIIIEGDGNQIYGNKIGTTAAGAAGIVNLGPGILFASGNNNSIGGTLAGQGNTIAFNTGAGIAMPPSAGTGNTILGNSIYSNTGLGIDLNNDGVTANDPGDGDTGPNNLQNYPVLTSATIVSTTQANFVGTLNSTANNQFRIEFFSNAAQDPTGHGEGQTYLGFVNVTTDGSGNASFNTTLTATISAGSFVSATATKSNATFTTFTDTSEFATNTVVPANTAPTLNAAKSPALTTETEDAALPSGPVGTLVSALVDFAIPAGQVDNVTDPNPGALLGIAITGKNTANGTLYYSIDGGTTWNLVGPVANNSALLLAADANTRLYFKPNPDWNTTLMANAITIRAWDQTSGSNGLSGVQTQGAFSGGTTAFSTVTDTVSLVVTAVNDAPIASGTATLAPIVEDAAAPVGATVTALFSGNFSDALDAVPGGSSANTFAGIAISNYTANASQGAWQYSTNGGTTWVALANATAATAVTLNATDLLRFVPVADFNGAATALSANLIESGLAITSGATVDLTLPGATGDPSHISTATVALGETITPAPPAPVTVPLFFPPPVPAPAPAPAPAPVLGAPVSPVSPPPSSSVVTPVVPPPVSTLVQSGSSGVDLGVVGADDPAKRVALPSRTFARVEQPDVVLDKLSGLSREPLSNPVKTMLVLGHKLAERLNQLGDDLERAMQEREHRAQLMGQAASISAFALTAGFVAWLLHGGSLLASFLVSLPAWRHFDPLPVLGTSGHDRRKRDRKRREEDEQENKQFRGLDRVLKNSGKPAEPKKTGSARRPKS